MTKKLTAQQELDNLRAAARDLLKALDQIEKDTQGIFVMAAIHGSEYKGKNWGKAVKKLLK